MIGKHAPGLQKRIHFVNKSFTIKVPLGCVLNSSSSRVAAGPAASPGELLGRPVSGLQSRPTASGTGGAQPTICVLTRAPGDAGAQVWQPAPHGGMGIEACRWLMRLNWPEGEPPASPLLEAAALENGKKALKPPWEDFRSELTTACLSPVVVNQREIWAMILLLLVRQHKDSSCFQNICRNALLFLYMSPYWGCSCNLLCRFLQIFQNV